MPQQIRIQLANLLQVSHIGTQDKYLGLPTIVQRSKKETFSSIKEKVNQKLSHWKRSLLSSSGREQGERKMIWIGQDKLCRGKMEGGLGFKDLKAFNLSMLGKQCQRLLVKEQSLFYKVFKAKYFRYGSFLSAGVGNNPSWAWRSLLESRKVIEKGTKWQVGNGVQIEIKSNPWLFKSYPFTLPPNENSSNSFQMVKQLMRQDGTWNENLIRTNFSIETAEEILQTSIRHEEDKLIWMQENGSYSLNSGYSIAFEFFHPPIDTLPSHYFKNRDM